MLLIKLLINILVELCLHHLRDSTDVSFRIVKRKYRVISQVRDLIACQFGVLLGQAFFSFRSLFLVFSYHLVLYDAFLN